jgi:hypothetical protein
MHLILRALTTAQTLGKGRPSPLPFEKGLAALITPPSEPETAAVEQVRPTLTDGAAELS